MDKLHSFTFESRTWCTKQCRKVLEPWTFGHAVRRKRSVFAFGSTQGEFGSLEVILTIAVIIPLNLKIVPRDCLGTHTLLDAAELLHLTPKRGWRCS